MIFFDLSSGGSSLSPMAVTIVGMRDQDFVEIPSAKARNPSSSMSCMGLIDCVKYIHFVAMIGFSKIKMTPYWYQLWKEDGTSMGSITKVRLSPDADVDDFRDAVKVRNGDGLLKGISPAELTVYENKTAYDRKETHMEEDATVSGLGESKKNALAVVVPNSKLQGITVRFNGRNSQGFRYFRRNYKICQET